MSKKKLPFRFGDTVRCTNDFESDFGGYDFDKGNLYLVADTDSSSEPVQLTSFESDEDNERDSAWLALSELSNFELVHRSPVEPEPSVDVTRDGKTIVVKIEL